MILRFQSEINECLVTKDFDHSGQHKMKTLKCKKVQKVAKIRFTVCYLEFCSIIVWTFIKFWGRMKCSNNMFEWYGRIICSNEMFDFKIIEVQMKEKKPKSHILTQKKYLNKSQ